MNKCVIFFVEGSTDLEFYKELVKYIRNKSMTGKLQHKIIYRNVKGIGGYKKEVNRIFTKEILPKIQGDEITVVLCYDTDVFGYVQKPRINWKEIEGMLINDGANQVIHVKAEKSIEDWFLIDIDGVCDFLKIDKQSSVSGKNGYEKLKQLFRKGNKIYNKGVEVKGFIQALDIGSICEKISKQINVLFKLLL